MGEVMRLHCEGVQYLLKKEHELAIHAFTQALHEVQNHQSHQCVRSNCQDPSWSCCIGMASAGDPEDDAIVGPFALLESLMTTAISDFLSHRTLTCVLFSLLFGLAVAFHDMAINRGCNTTMEKAIEFYRLALRTVESDPRACEVYKLAVLHNMGHSYLRLGDKHEAARNFGNLEQTMEGFLLRLGSIGVANNTTLSPVVPKFVHQIIISIATRGSFAAAPAA